MHPRTSEFVRVGLFEEVSSFAELERRIAGFETTNERGSAFEVFAEAYLATQRVSGAAKVWHLRDLPTAVARKLGLDASSDMGVDGVVETSLGTLSAYQVKFRSGRPALTWHDLATFMGLTDQADHRILFTNCDRLPSVINERSRFHCIRGSDLDRLGRTDFDAIRAWLTNDRRERKKKTPRPHQQEALDAIIPALRRQDRVTAVMASATGKTLVSLWVAEQTNSDLVLVLVPSLALLRQTLHEWMAETTWPSVAFLCVCSDSTVQEGIDEWLVRQADVDFPVTTDAKTVHSFFSKDFDGTKLILTTYQSTHVVAEAMEPGLSFDLAIFDEAHRTAGREGRPFSRALHDTGLRINKRLFLTATPRHYDCRKKDEAGDAMLVYSMDAPTEYGTVVHTLTFGEAARRGIICSFHVVISVVTSEMVTEASLRYGTVLIEGDLIKARQVANQIALFKATEAWNLSKVFTFHRSVKSAQSFTRDGPEGITTHLPSFEAYHVNGKMLTARRDCLMAEFRSVPKAIMSNARCLTEGVDVPAVDMVAFFAPKRSRIDIVQAVGRALRRPRHGNKSRGFVLIPLYVEQAKEETVEEAVARTGYDDVWQVLQALQEQDEVLAEIIRDLREQYGATGGFDDMRFQERVTILGPESLPIDVLRKAITTECIERLGSTWDHRFGELKSYQERFGDCNVPLDWGENPQLGSWVHNQRQLRQQRRLRESRVRRLDALGFDWRTKAERVWEQQYQELVKFERERGHCNVPQYYLPNPSLGMWVSSQRRALVKGHLSSERKRRLVELGFQIKEDRDDRWERGFGLLEAYKREHGDCHVPITSRRTGDEKTDELVRFVIGARLKLRQGTLDNNRMERLQSIGFDLQPHESVWRTRFAQLVRFKDVHGHCNATARSQEHRKLARWLEHQRRKYADGKLRQDHQGQLEELGVEWPQNLEEHWQRRVSALVAFMAGKSDYTPKLLRRTNPTLAAWVADQAKRLACGVLSEGKAKQLYALGVTTTTNRSQLAWKEGIASLTAFRKEHGHCDVPSTHANRTLALFVMRSRRQFRLGALDEDQIDQLERVGFAWEVKRSREETRFRELAEYKKIHGHTNVPRRWPENRKLATWIWSQHRQYKDGSLSEERQRRLEEIGVEWL